jgi:hypothetical protein
MRSLKQVLTNDYGLNLAGWTLNFANGISADGLTVVGLGTNPSGNQEAWIARLDAQNNQSVPEPSSILGLYHFSKVMTDLVDHSKTQFLSQSGIALSGVSHNY